MNDIQNINEILSSFKIFANCKSFKNCKNACFYDLELLPGGRVQQLEKYAAEIALALKAPSKPRFEIISNDGIIRCEVIKKREHKTPLFKLGEQSIRPSGDLTCLLGETLLGDPLWIDIAKQPHILVAGTTGSGKSTLLHAIIANMLLYSNVRLFLVDPKNIEFFKYQNKNIKNVNVVYNYSDSIELLEFLCKEMDNRYALIREGNINIANLPFMILIIDEFADLKLQDDNNQLCNLLCKLAQKSRAAKIHIICSTQRPSVNIIDGAIKANFPTRISCKVATSIDSRVILDSVGAENLIGLGDAILNSNQYNLLRFQAAYITDEQVCEYLG